MASRRSSNGITDDSARPSRIPDRSIVSLDASFGDFPVTRLDRRSGYLRFEAPATAACARPPVGFDDDVADVAGVAGRAVEQATVDDDPPADSRRHDHADVIGLPRRGPEPSLGDGKRLGVVVHHGVEAGVLGDAAPQRELAPLGDVER